MIDTNVLLVANGAHRDVSAECQTACVQRLLAQQQGGVTVIDDEHRILSEYLKRTHPNQPKGVGDAFLKWLLQNQHNSTRVHQVALNEVSGNTYAEFPGKALQARFDASDRKFAAVAHAHPDKPPVWQAADCKWLEWWHELLAEGVKVEFLCRADVLKVYRKKFPKRIVPKFPEP
ncbi:MAG: hypothetical protein AB7V26_01140 [Lysobacterales bacterium]